MKAEVVPHIFACQNRGVEPIKERSAAKKRKRQKLVEEACMSTNEIPTENLENTADKNSKQDYIYSTNDEDLNEDEIYIKHETILSKDKCTQVDLKPEMQSIGIQFPSPCFEKDVSLSPFKMENCPVPTVILSSISDVKSEGPEYILDHDPPSEGDDEDPFAIDRKIS